MNATTTAVLQAIPDEVIEEYVIKRKIIKPVQSRRDGLLSADRTREFCGGISKMGLHRLVYTEKSLIPVWIGNRQMFHIKDLEEFIKKNKGISNPRVRRPRPTKAEIAEAV